MHLLIAGAGYTGRAVALRAARQGIAVTVTTRREIAPIAGVRVVAFEAAAGAIADATHLLATAPPDAAGDPVLAAHGAAIRGAARLGWVCYLSTTGVYGDRGGGWVDETTAPAPRSARAMRRLRAEQDYAALGGSRAVELFRLAGIYGPGRSAFDDLRAGTARRIIAPAHKFGRIHVDDIAGAVLAAMARAAPGVRVLNGNDDEPAASAEVIEEAARLLGVAPPPAVALDEAWPAMSEMARSFWAENRRVASRLTQQALGRNWLYPSYREGLRAILAAEGRA